LAPVIHVAGKSNWETNGGASVKDLRPDIAGTCAFITAENPEISRRLQNRPTIFTTSPIIIFGYRKLLFWAYKPALGAAI
jgi:hypothetical protein